MSNLGGRRLSIFISLYSEHTKREFFNKKTLPKRKFSESEEEGPNLHFPIDALV